MVRVQNKGTQDLLTGHLRNSKLDELIFVLNWSGKEQIHGVHVDWMGLVMVPLIAVFLVISD